MFNFKCSIENFDLIMFTVLSISGLLCQYKRPFAKWCDDLRRVVSEKWMTTAEDRTNWCNLGEALCPAVNWIDRN